MTATDNAGRPLSYLQTEANFLFLKDLESRNLVVPVIGDFAGPKADPLDCRVSEGARRDGRGLLPVERRAVSQSGWQVGRLLPEFRDAAARCVEHVHSFVERTRRRLWLRLREQPRLDGGGSKEVSMMRDSCMFRPLLMLTMAAAAIGFGSIGSGQTPASPPARPGSALPADTFKARLSPVPVASSTAGITGSRVGDRDAQGPQSGHSRHVRGDAVGGDNRADPPRTARCSRSGDVRPHRE